MARNKFDLLILLQKAQEPISGQVVGKTEIPCGTGSCITIHCRQGKMKE